MARARSQEGLIVVKVFVIHDPTLPLSAYKDKLEDIRSKLASAVNCLPFQRMIVSISIQRMTYSCVIDRRIIRNIYTFILANRKVWIDNEGIRKMFSL